MNADSGVRQGEVLPFILEKAGLRGRISRLSSEKGHGLDAMMVRHGYPEVLNPLVAEAAVLVSLLADLIKFDGLLSIQTSSDGPVPLIVADMDEACRFRAYARFEAERLPEPGDAPSFRQIVGDGVMMLTLEQSSGERYQAMVELAGECLADAVAHYFEQSEQLESILRIWVRQHPEKGWQGGGIMLQKLAAEGGSAPSHATDEEDMRRARILVETLKPDEICATDLPLQDLLYRLFHDEGAVVFPAHAVTHGCRCSVERAENLLRTLADDEKLRMIEEGGTDFTCAFCSTRYHFDVAALAQMREVVLH